MTKEKNLLAEVLEYLLRYREYVKKDWEDSPNLFKSAYDRELNATSKLVEEIEMFLNEEKEY